MDKVRSKNKNRDNKQNVLNTGIVISVLALGVIVAASKDDVPVIVESTEIHKIIDVGESTEHDDIAIIRYHGKPVGIPVDDLGVGDDIKGDYLQVNINNDHSMVAIDVIEARELEDEDTDTIQD